MAKAVIIRSPHLSPAQIRLHSVSNAATNGLSASSYRACRQSFRKPFAGKPNKKPAGGAGGKPLKKDSACFVCGLPGYWQGDPECRGPGSRSLSGSPPKRSSSKTLHNVVGLRKEKCTLLKSMWRTSFPTMRLCCHGIRDFASRR